MPELPEVETIVRGLQGPLVGRTFIDVIALWPNSINITVDALKTNLVGQRIEALKRRGKYLQISLSTGEALFLHLRMSGDLQVAPVEAPLHPHVRTVFELDNAHQLRFKDPRKFGRVHFAHNPADVTAKLGPEPLSADFTVDQFRVLFNHRRGRLKPLLMDQAFIAGLGNIYAAESCFLAGLDPRRPANTLSAKELTRLYFAIRRTLRGGILLKGASFDAVYRGGKFQNHFQVYGRAGEPCFRCGTPISRIILGGRSTFFCPVCQPASSTA